jgi:short-subunit dehydrogenase
MPPSAIIIGASSGIGRELCRHLASKGYRIGIAARRTALLEEMAKTIPQICQVSFIDVSQTNDSRQRFKTMFAAMTPVDYVFLCAGTGHPNPGLEWELEAETIQVNALGFAALASTTITHFLNQKYGHLIGITSVAAVRGNSLAPAYGATKIFESHYLEALRIRANRAEVPVFVTEIRPGFVDTAMMKTNRPFWVASPSLAAKQIAAAAEARRPLVYVTARWRLFAWLLRLLPWPIYHRLA